MALYFIKDTTLTDIADAIRSKTGDTEIIPVTDMATKIGSIETGSGSGGSGGVSIASGIASGTAEKGQFGTFEWVLLSTGELILFTTESFVYMRAYSTTDRPSWESYKDQIKTVTFCSTAIMSVGSHTFYNYPNLTTVNFSKGITRIDGSAFNGCSAITTISIPTSCNSIAANAFANCTALTSVTFDNTSGWMIMNTSGNGGSRLNATTVANTSTMARYLTSTYVGRNWTRA